MKKAISILLSLAIVICSCLLSVNTFAATPSITVGNSVTGVASRGDNTVNFWVKFQCNETAYYEFTNTKINTINGKVYGYLYDENKLQLDVIISTLSSDSFTLCKRLEAEKIYYYCIKVSNSTYNSITSINYHNHNYNKQGVVKAMCDNDKDYRYDGYSYSTCSMCNFKQKISAIPCASKIELSSYDKYANGREKEPSITVKDKNGNVISSNNYSVEYINNISPGKATAVISFNGNYDGELTKSFYIYPAKGSIANISPKSKGFKVSFNANDEIDGYELQYSTSKDFSSSDTRLVQITDNDASSKSIGGLKAKKKYYVRIREYKVIKGKYYYGKWSSKIKTTTK